MSTERLIVAEFHKTRGRRLTLFSLTTISEEVSRDGRAYTSRTQYDVNHSRQHGYIFHQSGGGGGPIVEVSGIYFASCGAFVKETPCQLVDNKDRPPWRSKKTRAIRALNRTRRLRSLPRSFVLQPSWDLLTWLEYEAIQGDAVWCSTCRDDLPETDLCEHVWWCDETGEWSTPDERCKCAPGAGCRE